MYYKYLDYVSILFVEVNFFQIKYVSKTLVSIQSNETYTFVFVLLNKVVITTYFYLFI